MYFLEAGLILIVAPWSGFWDRNYFSRSDVLGPILANPFVRGGVSGLGLVTALAGFAELAGAFGLRRHPREPQEPHPH
ncbi:MAG TPA: hypothetical protein VM364_00230 [Vicinamibacterales bacterium]|nr:hypothetical protein [Vicinamibacterales bacterium]